MAEDIKQDIEYGSDSIRTLDWKEHIRRRPGMYIGKLGDGTHADDGIYVLLKEVIDNAIDEFMMGYGKQVIIDIEDGRVSVRDYGRGIPLDKVVDVSSKMNTGAKYDSKAFKKIGRPQRCRYQSCKCPFFRISYRSLPRGRMQKRNLHLRKQDRRKCHHPDRPK